MSPLSDWKNIPSLTEIRKSEGGDTWGENMNLKSYQDIQIEPSGKLFKSRTCITGRVCVEVIVKTENGEEH